jgi:hypothetical protein
LYDSASDTLSQITDDNVRDIYPHIGDDGTIAWVRFNGPNVGQGPTTEVMMRTPDGVVTQITDNTVSEVGTTVNSRQQIVWQANGPPGCGAPSKDIYMYDRGTIRAITTSGMTDSLENQVPEINEAGQVFWTEYDFCDPPPPYNFTSRLMLHSNGKTQVVPAIGVAPSSRSLNDRGWAAWTGFDPVQLRRNVQVWDTQTTTILTEDGAGPSLNNLGDVAFHRWNDARRLWEVWRYRDAKLREIATDSFSNHSPWINDSGEIVWAFGTQVPDFDVRMLRRYPIGDVNCDGSIDAFDIEPFVTALVDPEAYLAAYPTCDPALADANGDERVDAFDIEPFTRLLIP